MRKTLILFVFLACLVMVFSGNANAQGRLFWADTDSNTIQEIDPDTAALINSFTPPITVGDCSGLAFAGDRMFFTVCGSTIYELNPSTGAVVNSFASPSSATDALGFSGTELYVLDYSNDIIYVFNPNTGATIRTLVLSVDVVGGISYAGGRNSIFASDAISGTIYEIDAVSGVTLNSFSAPVPYIYGVGYSFARRTLFLGDVGGQGGAPPSGAASSIYKSYNGGIAGGGNTIYEVNPDTGAVINTLPPVPVWALAADENGVSIPTMSEWGMIIFMALAGIGAVYYLRKYSRA